MGRPEKTPSEDALLGANILFEQAAVGIAQIDTTDGRFMRVNKKYCQIMGYSEQELSSLNFMNITHPDDLANSALLQQVVVNLCTNAWHAIEEGAGRITLTLEEVNETSLSTLTPGRYARITVTDNGKGISPADLERIFEPFFTTKDTGKGSGLGLSVVHGITSRS